MEHEIKFENYSNNLQIFIEKLIEPIILIYAKKGEEDQRDLLK